MCVPFLEGQGRNQTIYDIYSEAFGNLTAAVLPQYSGTLGTGVKFRLLHA